MRIDLHTHSDRSDGTLRPSAVVRAARAAGLDVLGLTDHDTTEGWDEAAATAREVGLGLVLGIEISCTHAGHSAHLLAYLPDPAYPPLRDGLALVLEGRDQRMPSILAKLRGLDIDIDEATVVDGAGEAAAIGRPHIADALMSRGIVGSREEAFDRFLSPGRPAYVHRYAPGLEDMIGVVRDAGGVAVLAHPWGRSDTSALQQEGLTALREAGLSGLEVDHQDHSPAQRRLLRGLARELDLLVTGSSDFHGAGKVDHDLGCNTTAPDQLERLLDLAGRAAEAAGRRTPAAVLP